MPYCRSYCVRIKDKVMAGMQSTKKKPRLFPCDFLFMHLSCVINNLTNQYCCLSAQISGKVSAVTSCEKNIFLFLMKIYLRHSVSNQFSSYFVILHFAGYCRKSLPWLPGDGPGGQNSRRALLGDR